MPSVKPRGDGWQVRWSEWRNGKRRQPTRTFSSKADAELFAAEVTRAKQWDREVDPSTIAVPRLGLGPDRSGGASDDSRNLGQAAFAYVGDCAARELTEGSLVNIQGAIRRFRQWVPTDSLEHLTKKTLRDYRAHLALRASGLYANDETIRLLGWWQWLDDEGWPVERSPRRLRLPRAAPKLEPYAPTWAEMDAVIRAAAGSWYEHLFVLERCTGLRSMMLLHFRWRHVDLERGVLTIPPRHPGAKVVAMDRGRVVPLAPVLVEELAGWGVREGWLIDRARSNRLTGRTNPDRRNVNRSHIRKYLEAAAPPVDERMKSQPTHSFRKGFNTGLARAGVSSDVLRYLVGHKGASTNEAVYTVYAQMERVTRAALEHVPPIDHEGPLVFIRPGDQRQSGTGKRWTALEVRDAEVVAISERGKRFTFARDHWARMAQ